MPATCKRPPRGGDERDNQCFAERGRGHVERVADDRGGGISPEAEDGARGGIIKEEDTQARQPLTHL